jgi:hypothetical protein
MKVGGFTLLLFFCSALFTQMNLPLNRELSNKEIISADIGFLSLCTEM